MKHPDATGYVRGLYSVPGQPPNMAQVVEKRFMKPTDDLAARAMRVLLDGKDLNLSVEIKSGWSRFILSLLLRNPLNVTDINSQLSAIFIKAKAERGPKYAEWK